MSLSQGQQPVQPSRLHYHLYREIAAALGDVIAAKARGEDVSGSLFTPAEARATLASLARVSRLMKDIVYPHIYTDIELTSSASLNDLLSTLTRNTELAQRIESLDVSSGLTWVQNQSWPHPPVIHDIGDNQELAELPLPGMQSDVRVLWKGVYEEIPPMAMKWNNSPAMRDGVLHLALLLLMLPNLRLLRSLPVDPNGDSDHLLGTTIITMPSTHAERLLCNLETLESIDFRFHTGLRFLRTMVLLPKLQTLDLPICRGLRHFPFGTVGVDQHSLSLRNVRIQSVFFDLDTVLDLLRGIQRLEVLHYPITESIREPANGGIIKQTLDNHRQHLKELNLVIDHHPNCQESRLLIRTVPLRTLHPSWSFAAYSNLRALHIPDICLGFSTSQELRRTNLTICLPAGIETLALMTWVAGSDLPGYVWTLWYKCASFERLEHVTLIHVQTNLGSVSPRLTFWQPVQRGRFVFHYFYYYRRFR